MAEAGNRTLKGAREALAYAKAEAKGEPLDAAEQFEALGAEATMNEVLQKDPRDVSEDLLLRLVEVLRQERAMMIQKGEAR